MKKKAKSFVPDTLMLEDRAALAINSMAGCVDEDYDYIPYMVADLQVKPAVLKHSPWDYGSSTGRLIDGITLARHMSGSQEGREIENHLKRNLFDFFGADGLSYRRESVFNEANANMHDQRSVLIGLLTWYQATGESRVKEAADRLCAALKRISLKEKDFWYFPCVEYSAEKGWRSKDAIYMHTASDPTHTNARQINPLIKYYELTGNTDALELAEHYTAHTVLHSGAYKEDGSFNVAMEFRNGHFHSRMVSLAAVVRFAKFTGNAFYLSWAKRIYDWALSQSTAFGWTPGGMVKNKAYLHETCTLTDFIEIGILLAQSGYPEYWNVVERFVRNQLVESQLLDVSWVDEIEDKSRDVRGEKTYYRVGQRMLGAFAGYAAPNDFVCEFGHRGGHRYDVQTCCLGSGTRGLFLAWSNGVTERYGRVSVNLLLNRGTRWLDVRSYLPHEGRVELDINEDIQQLLVRVPDWVPFDVVGVSRQRGEEVKEWLADSWLDGHVKVGSVRKGDVVKVCFPLRKCKSVERAVDQEFEVEWRGDDVVSIEPQGRYYPFYSGRQVHEKAPLKEGSLRHVAKELYW